MGTKGDLGTHGDAGPWAVVVMCADCVSCASLPSAVRAAAWGGDAYDWELPLPQLLSKHCGGGMRLTRTAPAIRIQRQQQIRLRCQSSSASDALTAAGAF